MGNINLDVYLYFKGQCREAMEFYKSIFGGELTILTYGEANIPGMDDPDMKDWAMHAKLEGGDIKLMASDTGKASSVAAKVDLSLGGVEADEERLRDIFKKLGEGGQVHSELKTESWGDTFGSLTDKYGVNWMMNIASASNQS